MWLRARSISRFEITAHVRSRDEKVLWLWQLAAMRLTPHKRREFLLEDRILKRIQAFRICARAILGNYLGLDHSFANIYQSDRFALDRQGNFIAMFVQS